MTSARNETDSWSGSDSDEPENQFTTAIKSTLQLLVTKCIRSPLTPWHVWPGSQDQRSAFVISGRRIVTNAHCVENASRIYVKNCAIERKFKASIALVSSECDIALLKVEDDDFWAPFKGKGGTKEIFLEPGNLPRLQDKLNVLGYSVFPSQFTAVAAVASRIHLDFNGISNMKLLQIQVDSAFTGGVSGGPVINQKGEVIGIAHKSICSQKEDIDFESDAIPGSFEEDFTGRVTSFSQVKHIIDDLAINKCYTGVPTCGFHFQSMENRYLRDSLGMTEKQTGIRISHVMAGSDAFRVLRKGDILTHIDNQRISNKGMVPLRRSACIPFNFIIHKKFVNDLIAITFIRNGSTYESGYRLSNTSEIQLVPTERVSQSDHDGRNFIVFDTLAFRTFTVDCMNFLEGREIPKRGIVVLEEAVEHGYNKESGIDELVILCSVLCTVSTFERSHDSKQLHLGAILEKVNGNAVKSLFHLRELLRESSCSTGYTRFDFANGCVAIIDRAQAILHQSSILLESNIQKSKNLLWSAVDCHEVSSGV